MRNIKILGVSLAVASTLLLASCSKSELDKVNENKNNPADVQAKFILTDAMLSTAFSVSGGDVSLYSSVYMEHEGGVWGQMYNAETRVNEPVSATTYNNVWNSAYNNVKALKIAVEKTSVNGAEEGNEVTNGIAKVLLAYNIAVLTDIYGDAPFTQSGEMNPDGSPMYMQPTIDKQSDLYAEIHKLLDEAIVSLDKTDAGPTGAIGSQDLIYSGNKGKWKQAAYGLKARYLMRTLKVSTDQEADLTNVLEYIENSITSAGDEFALAIYDGSTNVNPLFGYSNSRDGFGASGSLLKKFKALEDPRGEQAFMEYTSLSPFVVTHLSLDEALDVAVPNGTPDQQQFTYSFSVPSYASTAPTLMLSYHELLFLKAEALVRLERSAEAEDVLNEAIVNGFANLERTLVSTDETLGVVGADFDLSEAVANTYFTDKVLPRFTATPLKEVMLQKYLAFFGASGESTEAYNDYRRLKALGEEDFIELENPLNSNQFPLRFTYGNSDVAANPNVSAAYGDGSYVYTENVWWAGGTR